MNWLNDRDNWFFLTFQFCNLSATLLKGFPGYGISNPKYKVNQEGINNSATLRDLLMKTASEGGEVTSARAKLSPYNKDIGKKRDGYVFWPLVFVFSSYCLLQHILLMR